MGSADVANRVLSVVAYNARDYGAVGDGRTLDTQSLQQALDACGRAGGGIVFVPAGSYVTGSLFLLSHVTLHLVAGATLLGSPDAADYPVISSRWEGVERQTYAPLLAGSHLHDVAVVGQGTIDGRGEPWWQRHMANTLAFPRPRLISFEESSNILIEGITARNSPSWTINPIRCDNVTVHRVTIVNPPNSPNTDGINPESCSNVHISNCHIDVGDDCVTLKSGTVGVDRERLSPCENITISNCTMLHGHGGVVIGSEMSGDVRNVAITNCVFKGTDRGIRLKSRRGRGGVVEDVQVSNIIMEDVLCPLTMNLYYACGAWGDEEVSDRQPREVSDLTPRFRRIHVSHVTARGARYAAGFLYGLAEMPLEDISLSHLSVVMAADAEPGYPEMADDLDLMQRAGLHVSNVHGLRLDNVQVCGQLGPAFVLTNGTEINISASGSRTPCADAPVVRLVDVQGAFVHDCRASAGTGVFLSVEGEQSRDVVVSGNDLSQAAQPVSNAEQADGH